MLHADSQAVLARAWNHWCEDADPAGQLPGGTVLWLLRVAGIGTDAFAWEDVAGDVATGPEPREATLSFEGFVAVLNRTLRPSAISGAAFPPTVVTCCTCALDYRLLQTCWLKPYSRWRAPL